ncbi:MAG TPA: 30S ribosomal protein S20 [Bacteroidales bacterium]|jgi:small subunit ribosomal protein S20|nr:30S ribosomal protein S20 [Bacteroidales bacterium]MDI9574327.1 30S ribosomal protein S20 [Bacteroidota bacterium]OQC61646.1 MAG: 30S ribosomal protein S20 [Bacteroidetes bacterium ADurb.Bin012]MBP9512593.1 30S ribosomal protein S20 [Bacteroidales bacterium]MBP9587517.1 30S ribosomal protein S20 [Bacteroidales bacterium]
MANHKSAIKRIKTNQKKRLANRYYSKTMRNSVKNFRKIEDKVTAQKKLPQIVSMIDKLSKKGIIHKNKAANLKSKLMLKVNTL